jgi:putative glutamine amidotransferase
MRPVIGITTSPQLNKYGWPYHAGYSANAKAVLQAGGAPLFIPLELPEDVLRTIFERVDGVLLSGGQDVDPQFYNAEQHELTVSTNPMRDTLEMQLAHWAIEDDRPLLGICRGHQVLNVALGGELVQDVATMADTSIRHDPPFSDPRNNISHEVTLVENSKLAGVLGTTRAQVNSIHHQAVSRAGDGLTVVGRSDDELIEATERPDRTFVMSIQWHPEDLVGEHDHARALFKGLVDAAASKAR